MSEITAFATLMVAISMAVERCVEILKGIVPYLATVNADAKKDGRRGVIVQTLAVGFGTLIAEFGRTQLSSAIPSLSTIFSGEWLPALPGCLLVGFMASGGSGFWNHILDLIGAMKIQQEEAAKRARTLTP